MPRATRRSLADASSQSRSRTPAKATVKTASPAASKSPAGGKGKAAEKAAESKRPARSTSRGKAAATAASPVQTATRESRPRSREAASKGKATPAPTKRGREKASKEEEEEEEIKPKRARSRGQSAGKSPAKSAGTQQRRGRSPAKAASAKSKAKSPAKTAASTSRAGKATVARKSKSPAKAAAPAKGKAKTPAKAAAAPAKRRSKTPTKAAAATKSPRTPASKTATKKKEELKKSTPRSRSAATPPSRASKSPRNSAGKGDKKKTEAKKSSPRGRKGTAASALKSSSGRGQEAVEPEEEDVKDIEEEKEATEGEKEGKNETREDVLMSSEGDMETIEGKEEKAEINALNEDDGMKMKQKEDDSNDKQDHVDEKAKEEEASKEEDMSVNDVKESTPIEEIPAVPVEAESEPQGDSAPDASEEKAQPSASETAAEPTEETITLVSSSEESSESAAVIPVVLDQDDKNGETDNIPSPPRSAVKRKFEEVSETTEDEISAKKTRENGAETEEDMEVMGAESSAEPEPSEADLLKDYVVISKDEVPAPDSLEVVASVPAEQKKTVPVEEELMETENEAGSSSTEPAFVVPLTQVEMIKACAYSDKNQATGYGDGEDASSVAVEVGSLASSEISSRHLDVSEVLSAANSTDGDRAADSCIEDSAMDSDKSVASTSVSETVPDITSSAVSSHNPGVEAEVREDPSSLSKLQDPAPAFSVDASDSACSGSNPTISESVADVSNNSKDVLPLAQSNPGSGMPSSSPPQPPVPVSAEPTQDSSHSLGFETDPAAPSTASLTQSLVTANLGIPDPAFLSAYSSPGVLNRAYVPNPAVPGDSVAPEDRFSLVSYNILAECNRVKADYSYTAEEFLCQKYRHEVLMKELQYLDGDVVCLQEVSPDYFSTMLLPAMKSLGYDGLMKRRTKDAYDEGEATFYKTSVFEIESSKGVSLSEVAFQEVEKAGVSEEVGVALRKYLDRADVVLVTRLRNKASGKVVTVGNIHVVWDFSRCPDVQCIQVACAIKEVVGMSGSEGAHIICGDFNSEWTTPAYQLVVDGSISESSVSTLQGITNLELENGAKSLVSHLRQAFQHTSTPLRSVYSTVTKSEPEITSLTSFMESAVDYQFYSTDSLMPVGVLKTVDHAVVKATGGLPTRDFPSDHVSMKSIFTFCK